MAKLSFEETVNLLVSDKNLDSLITLSKHKCNNSTSKAIRMVIDAVETVIGDLGENATLRPPYSGQEIFDLTRNKLASASSVDIAASSKSSVIHR